MQNYKQDCIDLHNLTSEDVSEIDELTDNWEDLNFYASWDDVLHEITYEFLSSYSISQQQVDEIMQFLKVSEFAHYNGFSLDLIELPSGKAVQSF